MSTSGIPPSGLEALDSPHCDAAVAGATLRDIALANRLFGGRSAVIYGLRQLLNETGRRQRVTVLDIGAGMGDVTRHIAQCSLAVGTDLQPIALDWHPVAAKLCRAQGLLTALGDVQDLPVAPRSVDIVVASQLLHHFSREDSLRLLRTFDRLARLGVVIADLERHRLAAAGIWAASFALSFHQVSRRDGVLSVRRGFTTQELAELLRTAGLGGTVHRRPGYRVVAVWSTGRADV
jgi:ubiquinone/menaquinone biosynthesis C-methylase UbiE